MKKLKLKLPPGYRFYPKDQEIIELFLKPKITGNDKDINHVRETEFYNHEPWDLQNISGIDSKDQEWCFFNAQSLKHRNGNRKNRTTREGFWKATGKDREIWCRGKLIGMKKTFVYHRGRTPNGEGTKWVMHEYRITQEEFDGTHPGQKAFVFCRLFNNEEKSKKGGSAKSKPALAPLSPASEVQVETLQTSIQSCYSEISDEMMSDVTLPVQSNNNNTNYHNADIAKYQAAELTYTDVDYFNVAEFLSVYNVPSLGDTPSSLSPIAPDILTPNISEDSTLISPLNNQDVDNETLKNSGSCGGSDANGQVDLDLDIWEAIETGYICPPGQSVCNSFSPSNPTPVTPVVSPRTIAEAPLKEAESMLAPASVPPELGCEAEIYPTSFRFSPAKNYDGITSNTKTPIEYKNDGYNTYVDRNQVEVVTSDKVEARTNMFSVSPEPLLGNMLSPFHSQVQGESYSSYTYHPSANDCHWGVYNQYGTNEPDPIISKSWDSVYNPDEDFRNASLIQNNLAVDDETLKNMASFMDNGSCSGSGANAQVDLDLDIWEAFKTGYICPPGQSECNSFPPSNSTPVTPVVSSRTIAEAPLKEAESMLAPASVPPDLGCEAENDPTSFRFSPAKNYDGITSNTKTPIEYKNDGYNTYVDRNQEEVVISDKVEARTNKFSVSPEPLLGNMLSPFHSQVQGESYSSYTYHPSANDCHWGVYNQYGTNEPDPIISKSWDSIYNPDEYFRNASLSQNYLAVDDETLKNMASFMDNGSCSGSGANAQSEQEYQGLVRFEEIIKPKVSSSV